MNIFREKIIVEGKMIGGNIVRSKFNLDRLSSDLDSIKVPFRRVLTKEELDVLISELESVRSRL